MAAQRSAARVCPRRSRTNSNSYNGYINHLAHASRQAQRGRARLAVEICDAVRIAVRIDTLGRNCARRKRNSIRARTQCTINYYYKHFAAACNSKSLIRKLRPSNIICLAARQRPATAATTTTTGWASHLSQRVVANSRPRSNSTVACCDAHSVVAVSRVAVCAATTTLASLDTRSKQKVNAAACLVASSLSI